QQQEVPVGGAQLNAQFECLGILLPEQSERRLAPHPQSPQQVGGMEPGEQIEERTGGIRLYAEAAAVQLLPDCKLSRDEQQREHSANNECLACHRPVVTAARQQSPLEE